MALKYHRTWKGARKREKTTITAAGAEPPESPGAEQPLERTRPTGADCRVRRDARRVRRPMASACACSMKLLSSSRALKTRDEHEATISGDPGAVGTKK